jgi:hypothetical protein
MVKRERNQKEPEHDDRVEIFETDAKHGILASGFCGLGARKRI